MWENENLKMIHSSGLSGTSPTQNFYKQVDELLRIELYMLSSQPHAWNNLLLFYVSQTHLASIA